MNDGIKLKCTAHLSTKNIFKRIWNYIYFNYIHSLSKNSIEEIEIEIDDE